MKIKNLLTSKIATMKRLYRSTYQSYDIEREFWLLFNHSSGWHSVVCKKGFSHVEVYMKDKYNWVGFRPYFPCPDFKILNFEASKDVPSLLKKQGHVLHVKFSRKVRGIPLGRFGWFNCTHMVQYYMSLPTRCCTPWRLYNKLLKIGIAKKV